MSLFIKAFKGIIGILISGSILAIIILFINILNRIELKVDPRYSSISLDISPSPVSASFVKLLYTPDFLKDHEQRIKSIRRDFVQLDPSDLETQNQLTSSAQELLAQNQTELQLIKSIFGEDGCGDDFQIVKEKRRSLLNLHRGLQLLLLSVYHARSTQSPNQTAPQLLSLIERFESKMLTCHHSWLTYIIFLSNYYLFYESLLPLLSHPNLSPSLSKQVLLSLTTTLTPQRQEAQIKARQNSLRTEYMTLLNLLNQSHFTDQPYTQLGLQTPLQKESLLQFGYMWDADQSLHWIEEDFRAQIWIIEQKPHIKIPKDLAINQLQKDVKRLSSKSFWVYFSYNAIGQLLYKIVRIDIDSQLHTFIEKECMFRVQFYQTLKRLKLDQPVILNPFTQHPFDLKSDEVERLSKVCSFSEE